MEIRVSKTNILVIICTIIICVGLAISSIKEKTEPKTESKHKVYTTYTGILKNVSLDDNIYSIYFDNGRVYFAKRANDDDSFIIGRRHEIIIDKDTLKKVDIINNQGNPGPIGSEPPK